jgi:hypothetical protein
MKKQGILIIAFFMITGFVWAQPGYMGKKRVVETNLTVSPAYVFRDFYFSQQYNYGLRYEKVTSNSASWIYGISLGTTTIDSIAISNYGAYAPLTLYNSSSGWSEHLYPSASMIYKYMEISMQRRWYLASSGAVAPYGMYFGLQTDLARVKQKTADLPFYSPYSEKNITFEPEKSRSHLALSESMVVGGRRMIQRNLTIGFNMSLGYVLFQTSRPGLAITESNEIVNHMDAQENIMVRHFAMRKLVQIGINLGYLF